MKFLGLTVSILLLSFSAIAGQIRFNPQDEPTCYTGEPKSALAELLAIDYDPALSKGRLFRGARDGSVLLYAEQFDENGNLLRKLVIPPCR